MHDRGLWHHRAVGHRLLFAVAVLAGGCSFSVPGTFIAGDASDGPGGDADDATDAGPSACRAVELSAMSAHTCARMENGDVWCWGINGIGQVGRPPQIIDCTNNVACNPTPEKLALPPVTRLGIGEEHMCAIAGDDTYCWGGNDKYQFGDGTQTSDATPHVVAERAGATQIVGGLEHNCSLHAGGGVKCSGTNAAGEVGDNSFVARPLPVQTIASSTVAFATGYQHMCAVQSGFVYCWGADFAGQTSKSIGAPVRMPTIVAGIASAVAVAGGYGHTCALRGSTGDVACWGANGAGQLGVGDMLPHPGVVSSALFTGGVEIVAGSDHSCVRTPAGSMFCWGEGYGGTPVQVPLPRPAVAIAAGSYHDCAALDDGTVWCKGWNAYGQLGLGTHDPSMSLVVTQVALCP
jgi:alpha-tubulin suppressor-like RCC1 family protein